MGPGAEKGVCPEASWGRTGQGEGRRDQKSGEEGQAGTCSQPLGTGMEKGTNGLITERKIPGPSEDTSPEFTRAAGFAGG